MVFVGEIINYILDVRPEGEVSRVKIFVHIRQEGFSIAIEVKGSTEELAEKVKLTKIKKGWDCPDLRGRYCQFETRNGITFISLVEMK